MEQRGSFYLWSISEGLLKKLNWEGCASVCCKEERAFWVEGGQRTQAGPRGTSLTGEGRSFQMLVQIWMDVGEPEAEGGKGLVQTAPCHHV